MLQYLLSLALAAQLPQFETTITLRRAETRKGLDMHCIGEEYSFQDLAGRSYKYIDVGCDGMVDAYAIMHDNNLLRLNVVGYPDFTDSVIKSVKATDGVVIDGASQIETFDIEDPKSKEIQKEFDKIVLRYRSQRLQR